MEEMEMKLSLMERPGEVEKSKRQNWSEECGKDRYTQGTEPCQGWNAEWWFTSTG